MKVISFFLLPTACFLALVDVVIAGIGNQSSCTSVPDFNFDDFTRNKPFVLNGLCTTPYNNLSIPAWADMLVAPSNFVVCRGVATALCYYSGPNNSASPPNASGVPAPNTPCNLLDDESTADCTCFETPSSSLYFVDINAILNQVVYLDTVRVCGMDGQKCYPFGKKLAPVCDSIFKGTLIPGADLISTFSFDLDRSGQIPIVFKNNSCPTARPFDLYAGCMTAPCRRLGDYNPQAEYPLVHCTCPTYRGPFQVGRPITPAQPCDLSANAVGNVWSAAYSTLGTNRTTPSFPGCLPDLPVAQGGCPLLPGPKFKQGDVAVPNNIDCDEVCREYQQASENEDGIEIGFTCDATLCTAPNHTKLVADACKGLNLRKSTEILKLEIAVQYSCAASQICGCVSNQATNAKLFRLNAAQRQQGIATQCEINGTLCGKKKKMGSKGMGKGSMMGMRSMGMSKMGNKTGKKGMVRRMMMMG